MKRAFQLAPIERLLRKAGAERVSPEAVKYLAEVLQDITEDIAEQAAAVAKHAKRKTITAEDIMLVTK